MTQAYCKAESTYYICTTYNRDRHSNERPKRLPRSCALKIGSTLVSIVLRLRRRTSFVTIPYVPFESTTSSSGSFLPGLRLGLVQLSLSCTLHCYHLSLWLSPFLLYLSILHTYGTLASHPLYHCLILPPQSPVRHESLSDADPSRVRYCCALSPGCCFCLLKRVRHILSLDCGRVVCISVDFTSL